MEGQPPACTGASGVDDARPAGARVLEEHLQRHEERLFRRIQGLVDKTFAQALQATREKGLSEEPVMSEAALSVLSGRTSMYNHSIRSLSMEHGEVGCFMRRLEDTYAQELFLEEHLTGHRPPPPPRPQGSGPSGTSVEAISPVAVLATPARAGSVAGQVLSGSSSQVWWSSASADQVQPLAENEAASQPCPQGGRAAAASVAFPPERLSGGAASVAWADSSGQLDRQPRNAGTSGSCSGSIGGAPSVEAAAAAAARGSSRNSTDTRPPTFQGLLPVPPPLPLHPTPPSSAAMHRLPQARPQLDAAAPAAQPPMEAAGAVAELPLFPGSPFVVGGSEERSPASAEDALVPMAGAFEAVQSVEGESAAAVQRLLLPADVFPSPSSGNTDDLGLLERLKRGSTRLATSVSSTVYPADKTQIARLAMERNAIKEFDNVGTRASQGDGEPSARHGRGEPLGRRAERRMVTSPLLLRACGVLPWDWDAPAKEQGSQQSRGSAGSPQGPEQPGAGAGARPCRQRLRLYCAASALYRRALLVLALAALGLCVQQLVAHVRLHAGGELTALAADFPLQDCVAAFGGMLGLMSLRHLAQKGLLGRADALLLRFAQRERIQAKWSSVSLQQSVSVVILWAVAVAARAAAVAKQEGSIAALGANRQTLDVGVFAFCSGLFTALAYCVLHVASGLVLMVDAFAAQLTGDFSDGVHAWNVLQAVIRQVCRAVERGFLVLLTTTFVLVLLVVVDLSAQGKRSEYSKQLIVLALMAMVVRLCFKAAEVTEKCARMPSLVNGVSFDGREVDPCRHYLVEYIAYSATGFYVKEVRLTTATILKAAYVGGLAIFSLLRWTAWSLP
mmetsp:Transcript_89706/g.249182  ORF Transcript_89706/g.249182 Transcript_89706/m.249182 type:complete len:847 (+) Transcript_89706:87-2627(+)